MEKNVLSYYDNINGIVVRVEIPYFKFSDDLGEKAIIIDDELITEKDEKNFLRWVLSYCEGIIEGTKDRHTVYINEVGKDYGMSCNLNNVGIKWFEITENDKYKVTFEFDVYEIKC
jgi:hypothetical protein